MATEVCAHDTVEYGARDWFGQCQRCGADIPRHWPLDLMDAIASLASDREWTKPAEVLRKYGLLHR